MITDDKPPLRVFNFTEQLRVQKTEKRNFRVKEKIKIFFIDLGRFLNCLFHFSASKSLFLIKISFNTGTYLMRTRELLRGYILHKLLWKRGTLFRPTSHAFVLTLASMVVIVGGGFSTSSIILGQGVAQESSFTNDSDGILSADITPETKLPEDRPREEPIEYVVAGDDTLTSIGEKFRVSIETIRYANNISNIDQLQIGQKLIILPVSGLRHKVKEGETVESIATKYAVAPQAIVDFNYLEEPFLLQAGQELTIPNAQIPEPPKPPVTPGPYYSVIPDVSLDGAPVGSGQFVWPANTHYITQYFRAYHPALDIANESPIYASDGGRVVEAAYGGWNYGYGKYIKIDHGNGYSTMYAHLAEVYVSVGEDVSRGQTIGYMGCTGRCWGTHVHFVVQYNGQYIDPLSIF